MKFKKVVSVLLVVVMASAMVTGCGAKEEKETKKEGEKTELQVAVFEGGYGREYWDAIAEAFEKENKDVDVVIQANPEIGDVIRPNILAGNPPDFIYLPSSNKSGVTNAMIKDKALADISDVMEKVEDKIIPGILDSKACQPYGDGKTYLAPIYYSTTGLWYNADFFEKNNLEVPTTWDDFFALGDKEAELGRKLFTYQGTVPSYLESLIVPAIASGAGVDVMNGCFNYDSEAWKNPKVKEVLENIAKIGTEGYLMDGTVSLDHTQAQSQWLLGNAMFHPNGSWVEGEMADAPKEDGFEYGYTAAPVIDANGEKFVYTQIEEMFIPAKAKNIDLAKKFLEFQYTDEAVKLNAEKAKGIQPVIGASEYMKENASPAVYQSYAILDNGYKAYIGNFAPVTDTEIIPRDEFYNQVGNVMTGKLSVDEWINKMVEISDEVHDKVVQ